MLFTVYKDISQNCESKVCKEYTVAINLFFNRFEDLRIRRVKKEGRKKSATLEKTAPKDGRSDKVASLLFTAVLETEQGEVERSVQSKPISLSKFDNWLLLFLKILRLMLDHKMIKLCFCLQPQLQSLLNWTGWSQIAVISLDKRRLSSRAPK